MRFDRFLVAALLVCPIVVHAADAPTLSSADTAWMLTSAALVLFMTLPGLALFYGGLVRTKNVLSVLMQCFAITAVVSVAWALLGYSLAFGDGGSINAWLGGSAKALLAGIQADTVKGTIPETVFVMYQLTFAVITPALVVGGFAERMKFSSMLLFSTLWLFLVYIPVAHWVWGDGWLQKMGILDFAGGTVVHINAGVAALVSALVLGPRRGFPQTPMLPHNMTMTVAGAGMLWVGWFGFNAGSALGANPSAGMAMLVTHLAAAAGVLSWSFFEWVIFKKPSMLGAATGMVAGLGTITPASGFVGPLGAVVIGLVAGTVCFFATQYIKRTLRIDDSLDVFSVHGVGGILGTLSAGVFAGILGGVGYAQGMTMGKQVWVQLVGVGTTVVWSGVVTWILLKLTDVVAGLRVAPEHETEGLDTVLHNETGYNL
ncbi:MAG: ammonium transporter [Sulfurifustis sp.]